MTRLFRLPDAVERDPAVDRWLDERRGEPGALARRWWAVVRACGPDVREVLHDRRPTACVGDVAFAYVDAFTRHAAVGFYHGDALSDPAHLLEGTGKHMRHVKVRPDSEVDVAALSALVQAGYADVRARTARETSGS